MNREQKLEETLRMLNCPRPCNHRPDEFSISDCVKAGECGCVAGAALSAPKAEAVTVKPLEWGETSYGNPEVTTIVGVYRINESMAGGWSVVAGKLILKTSDGRVNFPTKDAAKAAAQADYEARVLSAIGTSPVPALTDEAVERARKAYNDAMRKSGKDLDDCWKAALRAAYPSKGEGE